MKKKIEDIEKRINNKENKEKKSNDINFDSNICSLKEIEFIINYLKMTETFKNKNINFILLYRATRDGDDTLNVHNKCDNYKNVMYFMKSEQGNIFGGFSEIGWETRDKGKQKYPIDDNAFIFSVNKRKIYKSKKGKVHICWIRKEYGLCFFNNLGFFNRFLEENYNIVRNGIEDSFEEVKVNDLNNFNEESFFKLSELEVYKIE